MSLLRQLLLSVTLAIAVILVGTIIFSVSSARQYLDTQLQAQSDSTATSLALTLSQPTNQDPSIRELLISVLFDSGEFRTIEFLDPTGRIMVRRELAGGVADSGAFAPGWFSQMLPLQPHLAQRQVSDGWRQLGVVRLQANDAYARNILWTSAVRIVSLTLAAGIVWGVFVIWLSGWLRRALRDDVAERVRAMAQGGDDASLPPVRHPRLVELREISQVITHTHERVQATASEREAKIESLELELNRDAVTGLANRKYFMNELARALAGGNTGIAGAAKTPGNATALRDGHLMLFRLHDLKAINAEANHRVVDQWLRNVGQLVQQVLHERLGKDAWLARINGSDFAFLLPVADGPAAVRIAQAVARVLQAQRIQLGRASSCRWYASLTDYSVGDDLSSVLSRVDAALMRAESAGSTDVSYLPRAELAAPDREQTASEQSWRVMLENGLAQGGFQLEVQPQQGGAVEGAGAGGVGGTRALGLLQLREGVDQEPLSGYLFMPAAVRLGMSAACDLRAFELALDWLRSNPGELILRVSLASILADDFATGLTKRLINFPELSSRLLVELDAYGLMAYHAEVLGFVETLRKAGVRTGLRGYGEQPDALLYLYEMRPAYIKISARLHADQTGSNGARHLLEAVRQTAQELDSTVLMEDGARV